MGGSSPVLLLSSSEAGMVQVVSQKRLSEKACAVMARNMQTASFPD